jgi:hypothetical protein
MLYLNRLGFSGRGFLQIDQRGYRIVPQPARQPAGQPKKVLASAARPPSAIPTLPIRPMPGARSFRRFLGLTTK